MLSDPAFPQLSLAFQPETMRGLLQEALFPGAQQTVARCEIGERRYAPGKRMILTYRLDLAAQGRQPARQQLAAVRLCPLGADASASPTAALPGQVYLSQPSALAWLFPYDPRLPGLSRLQDHAFLAEYLPGLLTEAGLTNAARIESIAMEVLHYLPETSCMLRYRLNIATRAGGTNELRLYGKIYSDASGARVHDQMRQLAGQLATLARPLRYDAALNTLWQSHVGGVPVEWPALSDPARVAGVARAVADFHGCRLDSSERFDATSIAEQLRATVKAAKRFAPAHLERVTHLVERLLATREQPTWPVARLTPVHRDLKLGNLLADDATVRLIDLDCVCLGDPLSDVGGLAASLGLNGLREGADAEAIHAAIARLWSDYAQHAGVTIEAKQAAWYTGAALLYETVRRSFRQFDDWRLSQVGRFIDLSASYVSRLEF